MGSVLVSKISFAFPALSCLRNKRADAFHFQPRFNDAKKAVIETSVSIPLRSVAERSRLTRNPTQHPSTEFTYIEIDDLDISSGEIHRFSVLPGARAPGRARKVVPKDAVIVSTVRPQRRAIALIPDNLADSVCSTGFSVLVPRAQHIDKRFLWAFLRSHFGTTQIEQLGRGASYPAVLEHELDDLLVPVLDLKTIQAKIAEKVGSVAELQAEAQRSRDAAQGTFSRYLKVHTSTQNDVSSSYKVSQAVAERRSDARFFHPRYLALKSGLRQIAEGSEGEVVKIGSLGEAPHRGVQPEYHSNGNIPVLKTTDVQNRRVNWTACQRVSESFFKQHPRGQLYRDDIVVTSTGEGSWGRAAIVDTEVAFADGHLTILKVDSDIVDPYALLAFLWSEYGWMQFEQRVRGSTGQTEIYPQDIAQISILIPPKSDQQSIRRNIKKHFTLLMEADRLRYEAVHDIESLIRTAGRSQ